MLIKPHGQTIFCDDIRQEAGNKFSLMGIFQGDMLIHLPFPATLPKLGLFITYTESIIEAPTKMTLMIYIPGDTEEKPSFTIPIEWPEDTPQQSDMPEDKIRQVKMQFVLTPIVFKEPGRIRVRMDKMGTIVKLGSMKVQQGPPLSQQ
jgi:hypothetical protein